MLGRSTGIVPISRNLFRSRPCATLLSSHQTAVVTERSTESSRYTTVPLYSQSYRSFSACIPLSFHCTHIVNVDEMKTAETSKPVAESESTKLSQGQRLKQAVKEYGATVVVFHTCISLFTLGVAYAAVSSGVDVVGLLTKLGVGQSILESKLATGASTFVIAYACHKVFVPARMATTLVCAPLIVRYLRRIGFLKHPVTKT